MEIREQSTPVFVISLSEETQRRQSIERHLRERGVCFQFVDAVDGRTLSEDERRRLLAPNVTLPSGHVGCYLSHIKAYQALLETNCEAALVLEDDARLDPKVSSLLAASLPVERFDYCYLDCENFNDKGGIFYDESTPFSFGQFSAHPLSAGPQAAHAFFISRKAARRRVEHALPILRAIDLYDALPYQIRFACVVRPKLAWLSEHGLASATFEKVATKPRFRWFRRSPKFYVWRDLITLRTLRWALEVRDAVRSGRLPSGRWRRLPSGKEIVYGR